MFRSACLAFAAISLAAGAARAADLTVTAFGGVWEQAFRTCYIEPFEKQTGKTVNVILGNPIQWVNQIAASPDHPPIDVIVNSMEGGYDAIRRGLVEPMTTTTTPPLAEINPAFVKDGRGYGTLLNYGAMGLAYNTDIVKKRPESWRDFVEGTVRGDWKAAIPSINFPGTTTTLIWLFTTIYGGSMDNIEPALAQIRRMKDSGNLVFYSDVNGFLALLKSGDADIGMYYDGRTWAFHDDGNPNIDYYNPKPGSVINPTMLQKVKNGSPLGWQLIDVMLSAGPQACWGNKMQYGMSNMNVRYNEKVAPRVPKLTDILEPPYDELPAHNAAWIEQWNREIGR